MFINNQTGTDRDIKRRLQREFYVVIGDRSSVSLWQLRAQEFFPFIEEELRRRNLPDDLKFLAIAESGLVPTARSYAGAAGTWQFIRSTGARYGLKCGASVDDRLDFERATRSALSHLGDLFSRFKDWQLAMAAYNCGETCVARAMSEQGVNSFWDLVLPLETERYVPRIIAISYVMQHLEQCNLSLGLTAVLSGAEHTVAGSALIRAVIHIPRAMSLLELSRLAGLTYRQLKIDNPQIVTRVLPAGDYELLLEKDRLKQLQFALDNIKEDVLKQQKLHHPQRRRR